MNEQVLSTVGRHLLDRRSFLGHLSSGVAGMALLDLLRRDSTRQAHHSPRAKQLLMIFCSGALSHVDTFDYKPELIARDGKPLPNGPKLTFQGQSGNLARPRWEFRPRGECGKMTSDLLPHLGALVDEMCFIHSMQSKTNTHGPGENVLSTGFRLDGFPSLGRIAANYTRCRSSPKPAMTPLPPRDRRSPTSRQTRRLGRQAPHSAPRRSSAGQWRRTPASRNRGRYP